MGNYRLEQFIGQSKIGSSFLARIDATTTYLVRFLEGSLYTAPKEHEVYLEHFNYQASQIATLQHPNILPLLDFGVFRGCHTSSHHTSRYDHYALALAKMGH